MFTIDAHLDLSMNALEWNRDLTRSTSEINSREQGMHDKPDRGNALVSLPALRKGNIGLVVATQIARFVAPENPLPGWNSPAQAWAQTQGQLAWYQAMVEQGEMRQIRNWTELEAHLAEWNAGGDLEKTPIGFILSLEGADSIVNLDYLEKAYESGLRALGPAHYGSGRYAFGTDSSAPLNQNGKALLRKMDELGIILDTTHLCDLAFWDALEIYKGPVWASHNNCRALVDHNR
jgi:membrane dipeptidase